MTTETAVLQQTRPVPTHDDLIAMVRECCPDRPPEQKDRYLMQTDTGKRFVFQPIKALRTIAKRWKEEGVSSKSAKLKLLELSWAEDWIRNNAELYYQAKPGSGRLVSKEAKITMLKTVYPGEEGPHWKDEIPVQMDEGVWMFRPVQWLDDVANNWMQKRSAVSLDEEQKRRLEELPWFRTWLQKLSEKRARKRAREELAKNADDSGDEHSADEDQTVGGSQESGADRSVEHMQEAVADLFDSDTEEQ